MPYRDAWDFKGPGLMYSWALIQGLFQGTSWGIRFADLVFLAIGLACVYRFARRLSPAAALPAASVLFAWFAGLNFSDTAQPDGWVAVLLAVVCLRLVPLNGPVTARGALVCGLILGWCGLFKPIYLVLGLVPLARTWLDWARGWSPALRNLGFVVLGGAVPVVLMAGWFWSQGSLAELIEANILYTATAYGAGAPLLKVRSFVDALLKSPGVALAVLLALPGLWHAMRLRREAGVVLSTWLIGTAACVALQAKYWPYHWTPMLYPLAIAAPLGAFWLGAAASRLVRGGPRVQRFAGGTVGAVLLIPTCLGSAIRGAEGMGRWAGSKLRPELREAYECREFEYFDGCTLSFGAIAKRIVAQTAPTDRILMWSQRAVVYHLSQRLPAIRFNLTWPLVRLPGNPYREKFRAEVLSTVRGAPPAYVIARVPRACDGSAPAELECLSSFPALANFVAEHYRLEDSVGIYGMYRLQRSP